MSLSVRTRSLVVASTLSLVVASLAMTAVPASAAVPFPVITSISGGYEHTCALTSVGGVKCWGWNQYGQLGTGNKKDQVVPVDVKHLTNAVAVSSGGLHTCALTDAGGVKCWGDNSVGELGDGTTVSSSVPVDVVGLTSGVAVVSAGWGSTCALTTAGGMKCWGVGGGALGDGTDAESSVPVDVVGLTSGVAAISAGGGTTCAVTDSGGLKCWGYNLRGQVGDGTNITRNVPVDVTGLTSGVATVSVGIYQSTCAVTISGVAKCWGDNLGGELGNGSEVDTNVPIDVTGLPSGATAISVGYFHTCALIGGGIGGADLWCWGLAPLGDATIRDSSTPVEIFRTKGRVASVSAGGFHTCLATVGGAARCWGRNFQGQLGNGTTTYSLVPADVFGPTIGNIHNAVVGSQPINTSGQISVSTTRSGADPYADITSFQVQEEINAGPWNDVILSDPMATSFTISLTPGNRYNFQIRDTDSSGATSVWSPGIAFLLNGFQEKEASYVGTWASLPVTGTWGGTVQSTTEASASAFFRFHGPNAVVIGTKGPKYGSADVYVDGTYVTTIDCNASSTLKRQALFSIDNLRNKKHSLEIVNQATAGHPRIDIDGFVSFRL